MVKRRGQDGLALLLLELAGSFGETFHQDGRCVYADDRVSISLIHETGTAPRDRFDNVAVYVGRLRPDGTTERLWTVSSPPKYSRTRRAGWKAILRKRPACASP